MSIGIIITRELCEEEISFIHQLLLKNPQTIIHTNKELPGKLNNATAESFELGPEKKRELNYEMMEKVLAYGEIKINDNSIADMLTFGNASLWHYHKFRIYFTVRNFLYEQVLVEQVSKKFDKIYYYGEKNITTGKIGLNNKVIANIKPSARKSKSYISLGKYAVFFGLRVLTGLFYQRNLKKKKHLLIDHSQKQTCLNIKSLKLVKDNYNLGYLFDRLDDEFVILDEIEVAKPTSTVSGLFNKYDFFKNRKRKYAFNEFILLKYLLFGNPFLHRKKHSAQLRYIYEQIQNNTTEHVEQLITENLITLHQSSLYYLFKYDAYRNFFSKFHFRTVTSIDENSPRIKTILDAAKSHGIKTIGIQHGTIHKLHPAYMYTQNDKKRNILPDYTLVWGEHWKNFLINEGNYPEETIHITGQIRTDIIPKIIDNPDLIHSFIQLPRDKKIILFASQPQRDAELRRLAAYDVFSAVKKTANTHLLFKLHPAEKNDFGYYHQIAKEADCHNYTIIYEADLYILIASADIVITCFSTVGAETTYFFKPLIILDHLKQDVQHYYKEDIAFQATDGQMLTEYIQHILDGKKALNKEAYNKYRSRFAYKIDGKVSERVINFIQSI